MFHGHHRARKILQLRRMCVAVAVVLVMLPFAALALLSGSDFDPGDTIVGIAQALGAGGDGLLSQAVASVARFLFEWWFVLVLLCGLGGHMLMIAVVLSEGRLAMPLRIGWSLLFLGLFLALPTWLSAAGMLVFAWMFLRNAHPSDVDHPAANGA